MRHLLTALKTLRDLVTLGSFFDATFEEALREAFEDVDLDDFNAQPLRY